MTKKYYVKRILICSLIILICLFLIAMSVEMPGFTQKQRFRIAERAQMVGPSQIIGHEYCAQPWGEVIIGQTDHGYTLFTCENGALFYHKKLDSFTTFCPYAPRGSTEKKNYVLPVIVFTENSSGTHAKLTVQIFNTLSGKLSEHSVTAKAERDECGYFLFQFPYRDSIGSMTSEVLTEMLNNTLCSWPLTYGTITLELYDNDANLLQTLTRDYYVPEAE